MPKLHLKGITETVIMAKKMSYISPAVRKRVSVELETSILTGSVVTKSSSIQTTGQDVVEYDFSDGSTFNSVWE